MAYHLSLIRAKNIDTLVVDSSKQKSWVEVRGKPNYETKHDPNDPLHKVLDTLDPATVSALMAGDRKYLNPKNKRTIPAIKVAKKLIGENQRPVMKLIKEEIDINDLEMIVEEKNGKKSHYIVGKFMQSECVNGNKRMYPKAIMEREVNRYRSNFVEQKRAYGELGHPDTPKINLDRISHLIVDLKEDGNDFIGKAKLLDTPYGNIAKGIIEGGGKLGVSSRGVGSVREQKGVNIVQDDFHLATAADIVADPSAPDAWVQGIMEGQEWVWDNGIWKEEDVSEIKAKILSARKSDIENTILEHFEKLFKTV